MLNPKPGFTCYNVATDHQISYQQHYNIDYIYLNITQSQLFVLLIQQQISVMMGK